MDEIQNVVDTPVSIDTTTSIDKPVSIDISAPGNPTPSPNTADVRSKKVSYGLGELLGKSQAEIYAGLQRGDEQSMRVEAASKIDSMNEQSRVDNLIGIVKANNGTLTMDQMEQLRKKPEDPNAVFEKGYAKKFLDGIYAAGASIGDTSLDSVSVNAPDTLKSDMAKGESAFGNIEYARTKLEDIQDQYEHQGWVPWIADQAKNIIPFYSDVKLRGWMESVPAFNWQLQGNNLYDQTRSLLRLPPEEFRTKYDAILTSLRADNPTLAMQYANAVVGMSTSDVGLANVNNIIDVSGLPGLTSGIKSVLKDVNTVRGAIRDGIKGSAQARPGPGQVAEAFGDTATAAVQRTTDIMLANTEQAQRMATNAANLNTVNDPIRQAKQALPTNFQLDKYEISANPGPLSRELVNRILQQQDVASNRIVDVASNVAKVQRIPFEEAMTSVLTIVKEEVKNQHPGIKSSILDVGDPVYNPIGNNYNFPVRIGHWTGEQFASETTAKRFAKEHGILEYELGGKEGARVYVPEALFYKKDPVTGERIDARTAVGVKDGEVHVTTYQPEVIRDKNGNPIGYSDTKFVEGHVTPSLKPMVGHVPIEVVGSGPNSYLKYHPTLGSEMEVTRAVAQQQGLGFHLLTWKPLDETQHVLKDMTLGLESTKSIASKGGVRAWVNSIFGYARSSDNTLSPFEINQRKTATYSQSKYQHLLQAEMKHVEDVARGRIRVDPITGEDIGPVRSYVASLIGKGKAKKTYDEFSRALAFAAEDKHPTTGVQGYFKRSPGELNEFYQTNFHRPVSFQEAQGYFAFVRNYENDRVFRSLREYTNKARLGAEQHQVTFTTETGEKIKSGFFDGVSKKEMPGGEYPVLDLTGQTPTVNLANKMIAARKVMSEAVKKGEYVVSEIYNPELRPLKGIPNVGNRYVRYVVTRAGDRETKGLDWQQVNRLSGGHFNFDFEHALKEARMRRDKYGNTVVDRYEGDTTFMALANAAQGQQIAKVLNEVKRILKATKVAKTEAEKKQGVAAAKKVFEEGLPGANGPAMEWKEFYARTQPMKVNGVLQPPSIDINEPFHVVPKGRSIMDLGGDLQKRYDKTFQDGTRSGTLARQYQVAYTQERDNEGLMRLRDIGTKDNPIYKYEPAPLVDPISTMNRALNQIVNSTFMDDMKIAGIEGWLREAEPYLVKDLRDMSRSAPFHVFNSATDRSAFAAAADPVTIANLLSNRFKTKQFIGVPSRYDLFMHDTADKVANWMYNHNMSSDMKLGPNGSVLPIWLLKNTTAPIAKLRAFAYHAKIGLFALPQVLTQLQSYVTIASLAPRSAVAGTWAATLHQWTRFAKDAGTIDLLDKYASKVNLPGFHQMKPGFFKEAMKELDNRGFANVGKEYGMLNNQLKHEYVKNEFGAFLDLGQTFFKNTEQHVRYGSWYTAAIEYQAEHPNIKVMSRTDWDKVLDRADDLSGNMSRASSSILQSGPLSLTGQFLTYQMHLAELFWGKRIAGSESTTMERSLARTRMYLAYSALFGMPMGIGISGLPLADYIRKAAIDNGYVVGDSWIQSVVMEGLPAVFGAWATSDDGDISKGNWYNFSKLGSGGFTQFNQLMSSDAKFWDFIGGASTSIMANTIKNSSGFVRSVASMLPGTDTPAFPMKIDDVVDIAKEVTAVNQSWKGITAVGSGKWFSKNEAYQADVSKANAAFMSATGLDYTNAADNYDIGQMIKDQTEAQKYALNRFTREFRRGVLAADNNDWSGYNAYMTRAFGYLTVLNYPEDKITSAIAIASKGYEDRIGSIREEFYTKNVPAGKEEQRMDAYTRFLQTQDK